MLFADHYGQKIIKKNLCQNLVLHLATKRDFDLISVMSVDKAVSKLWEMQQKLAKENVQPCKWRDYWGTKRDSNGISETHSREETLEADEVSGLPKQSKKQKLRAWTPCCGQTVRLLLGTSSSRKRCGPRFLVFNHGFGTAVLDEVSDLSTEFWGQLHLISSRAPQL